MIEDAAQNTKTGSGSTFRTAACWIFGIGGSLTGLVQVIAPFSWPNDRVSGAIGMICYPVLIPPLLRRVRRAWPATRSLWAPIIYAFAVSFTMQAVNAALTPSGAQLDKLRSEAISEATGNLRDGKPDKARFALRHFENDRLRDRRVESVLAEIDRRSAVPRVKQTSPATVAPALNKVPQSPASTYAERIRTYWRPAVKSLPSTIADNDEEWRTVLNQLDELARNAGDGSELSLAPSQKADRDGFIRALGEKQAILLPQIRKRYVEALSSKLFRDDIIVSVHGAGNSVIRFTGGMFSLNANIEDFQTGSAAMLNHLRFKRTEYRWSNYFQDGYRYDMKAPTDHAVATWNGSELQIIEP